MGFRPALVTKVVPYARLLHQCFHESFIRCHVINGMIASDQHERHQVDFSDVLPL